MIAELSKTHGHQTQIATTGEPKQNGIGNEHGLGTMRRQPESEDCDNAQRDRQDNDIEPAKVVRNKSGKHPTQNRAGVQVREEQVTLGLVPAMGGSIGHDERKRDE